MIDPKALSAEPNEYHAGNGRIAYVREAHDGCFMFYARPAARPDLVGNRIKTRRGAWPLFTDYHEAHEALAAYARQRGWKKVA